MNTVKNQLTGEYGAVPDTARYYKVSQPTLTTKKIEGHPRCMISPYCRLRGSSGWLWEIQTMERVAVENMLLWNLVTSGALQSLSGALLASMVH